MTTDDKKEEPKRELRGAKTCPACDGIGIQNYPLGEATCGLCIGHGKIGGVWINVEGKED